jgi:hypothetical protein
MINFYEQLLPMQNSPANPQQDPLDLLLTRYARESEPPQAPWFAARVIARLRENDAQLATPKGLLARIVAFALPGNVFRAAALSLGLLAAAGFSALFTTSSTFIVAESAAEEREVVEQLDVLLADVQSTFWQVADNSYNNY